MVLKEPEAKFEDIAASILISRTYMRKKKQGGLVSNFRTFLRHHSIAAQIKSLQSIA